MLREATGEEGELLAGGGEEETQEGRFQSSVVPGRVVLWDLVSSLTIDLHCSGSWVDMSTPVGLTAVAAGWTCPHL